MPRHLTFSPTSQLTKPAAPTGFSGIAYSGGVVPNYGWYGDSAIDIGSLSIPDQMFALVNHDPDQRAGHCRVWIEGALFESPGSSLERPKPESPLPANSWRKRHGSCRSDSMPILRK